MAQKDGFYLAPPQLGRLRRSHRSLPIEIQCIADLFPFLFKCGLRLVSAKQVFSRSFPFKRLKRHDITLYYACVVSSVKIDPKWAAIPYENGSILTEDS